ncbi:hypothetical protein T06_2579, partial [Trichinella sp. T6]
ISSSAEFLWCSFCSGQRDKSCSHHFVLNVVSQTSLNCFQLSFALNTVLSHVHINVASQTSVIGYVKRAHFINDSITLTSSEFDVSSDGPLNSWKMRVLHGLN